MNVASAIAQTDDAQVVASQLYEIALKNKLDELEILTAWIGQLASQLQLSSRDAFRVELVLTEAVTNIINYAYEDGTDHTITLRLHYAENMLRIELKDDGRAFDPLQKPAVVFPGTLEEATEGGLGIHLIRTYVDEWHYCRDSGHNILTLVMHGSDVSPTGK